MLCAGTRPDNEKGRYERRTTPLILIAVKRCRQGRLFSIKKHKAEHTPAAVAKYHNCRFLLVAIAHNFIYDPPHFSSLLILAHYKVLNLTKNQELV
jgi:hypothetical protein